MICQPCHNGDHADCRTKAPEDPNSLGTGLKLAAESQSKTWCFCQHRTDSINVLPAISV